MKQDWTPTQIRRAAWIGGGAVALIALVPVVPSVASALSPTSGSSAHGAAAPTLIHLEVVDSKANLQGGQIHQLAAGTQMYIRCPAGRALDGGYALPPSDDPLAPTGSMLVSAPDDQDSAKWNFRYSGIAPVGAKFYATCWQG